MKTHVCYDKSIAEGPRSIQYRERNDRLSHSIPLRILRSLKLRVAAVAALAVL